MAEHTHCEQPDREIPELVCGYPLPCPWHTAIIHTDKNPPTVEIPATAKTALRPTSRDRLKEIARTLEFFDPDSEEESNG